MRWYKIKKLKDFCFRTILKVQHPFVMCVAISATIHALRWKWPDIFDSGLMAFVFLILSGVASFLCGISVSSLVEKYKSLKDIYWSVSCGIILIIVCQFVIVHWTGKLFVIFSGIAITYYFLLGITDTWKVIKEKYSELKFHFVVEFTAFVASICAIIDALYEVIL